MARVSASFATPLMAVRSMPWDEALRWYPEAISIYNETWGRRP